MLAGWQTESKGISSSYWQSSAYHPAYSGHLKGRGPSLWSQSRLAALNPALTTGGICGLSATARYSATRVALLVRTFQEPLFPSQTGYRTTARTNASVPVASNLLDES